MAITTNLTQYWGKYEAPQTSGVFVLRITVRVARSTQGTPMWLGSLNHHISYMYPHGSIMSALISCGLVAVVIINITSPSVPTTPLQAFPFKTNNRRCRRLLLGSEIDALWFVMGTVGLKSGVEPASSSIACRVGINASCGATPFTCHLKCSTTGNRTIYAKWPSILNRIKHLRWYDYMWCDENKWILCDTGAGYASHL